MSASGVTAPGRRGEFERRWWTEAAVVLVLYVSYDATRGLRHGDVATAERHGRLLLHWERNLHLAPEHALNQVLWHLPALAVGASYFYATLHFIITPGVLVWLYRDHHHDYRRARTVLATATVGALAGFWLFPTAPPRLLKQAGIHDTLADVRQWGWWTGESSAPRGLGNLANEFAAMPFPHAAWSLWAGWLVFRYARRQWVRRLGLLYPILTALVVISTGNHYLFDVLAGAALVVAAFRILDGGRDHDVARGFAQVYGSPKHCRRFDAVPVSAPQEPGTFAL